MLRPFLGPRSSRFERLKLFEHVQLMLVPLDSIGSMRYPIRLVLGARVIEHLPDYVGLWCSPIPSH
eukprot:3366655-Alexandrium_andersonii.AAC.1